MIQITFWEIAKKALIHAAERLPRDVILTEGPKGPSGGIYSTRFARSGQSYGFDAGSFALLTIS